MDVEVVSGIGEEAKPKACSSEIELDKEQDSAEKTLENDDGVQENGVRVSENGEKKTDDDDETKETEKNLNESEDCVMNGVSSLLKLKEDLQEENEDGEDDDEEEEEHGYCVGDFVWGKIKNHPWWPGQIYDPSDASDLALKIKQEGKLLVAYFGEGTFAWCGASQLKPFAESFKECSKMSNLRSFLGAVEEAVEEMGRHIERILVCDCAEDKDNFDSRVVDNAGIKEGVLVRDVRRDMIASLLVGKPGEILEDVKGFAETVSFSGLLTLEILKRKVSAFYRSKRGYGLTEYHEPQSVPGLEDKNKSGGEEDEDENVNDDDGGGNREESEKKEVSDLEIDIDSTPLASLRKRVRVDASDLEKNAGNSETATLSRKKSKYLSPDYLSDFSRKGRKASKIESESSQVSSQSQAGEQMTDASGSLVAVEEDKLDKPCEPSFDNREELSEELINAVDFLRLGATPKEMQDLIPVSAQMVGPNKKKYSDVRKTSEPLGKKSRLEVDSNDLGPCQIPKRTAKHTRRSLNLEENGQILTEAETGAATGELRKKRANDVIIDNTSLTITPQVKSIETESVKPLTPSPAITVRPLKQTQADTQAKTSPKKTIEPMRNKNGLKNNSTQKKMLEEKNSKEKGRKRKREEIHNSDLKETDETCNGSIAEINDICNDDDVDDQPLSAWINLPTELSFDHSPIVVNNVAASTDVEETLGKDMLTILPFAKKSPYWKTFETKEICKTVPQSPHFSPLFEAKEDFREWTAVGMMVTFYGLLEEVKNLQLDVSTSKLSSLSCSFAELEKHGFEVATPQSRINKIMCLQNDRAKKEEERKCLEKKIEAEEMERHKLEEEMVKLECKILELKRQQEVAKEKKEAVDKRTIEMESCAETIEQEIEDLKVEFQTTASAPW